MKYKSILTRMAEDEEKGSPSRHAIPPPSSGKEHDFKVPPPRPLPKIEDPDLEEQAKRMKIYDERESPFWQQMLRNEEFEEALEKIKDRLYQKDQEEVISKRPTELFDPSISPTELYLDPSETTPTEVSRKDASQKIDKLLKLCSYFHDLSVDYKSK